MWWLVLPGENIGLNLEMNEARQRRHGRDAKQHCRAERQLSHSQLVKTFFPRGFEVFPKTMKFGGHAKKEDREARMSKTYSDMAARIARG